MMNIMYSSQKIAKNSKGGSHISFYISIYLGVLTIYRLSVVAEMVEHGSRVWEIVGLNPWLSQSNDL